MNSKVSKSEKTKLKFAQSNINHVYRGNTAEPHHKPTVRQYGMQVVGKVQGTRRLPPPAWVPSIKAETGGLDSRVTIVPPGGGGWGAPTETRPTAGSDATTDTGGTTGTTPLSSVNGSFSREAIGTSFEPAYTRSLGNKSETSNEETSQNGSKCDSQTDGMTAKLSHSTSETPSGTGTLSQPTAWTSKTQTTVASGGLAANKPFFQRPTPVTTSATTAAPKTEERKLPSTQVGGGASEIVGEPTGWAAVTEEEPNFDEQILFSDEEDSQEDSKSTLKGTNAARATSQSDANPSAAAPMVAPVAKQTAPAPAPFTEPENVSHTEPNRPFSSTFGGMSSSLYDETPRDKIPDTWPSAEPASSFATYTASTVSRHPTSLPFGNPPLSAHCGVGADSDRVLTVGQYMQHPIPNQGVAPSAFPDPYFPNPTPTNRMTNSGGLLDSILPPSDAETELQNAQRQARTQEFRSAVERARISRQQREAFPTEGESLLQKSVVNLISEPCDSALVHATQASNQSMLLSTGHSMVPPVIGGVVPQQLLLPNTYSQVGGQSRPSLAAAAAAATAAAMVCGAGGAPARLSTPGVAPSMVKAPHSQPLSVSSHSTASMVGSWQGSGPLPPNIPTSGFNNPKPPTVPQVLQSALSMATSGTPGAHPNGVYLNPDFFVERLLEILNQQQVVRPPSAPQAQAQNRSMMPPSEPAPTNPTHDQGRPIPSVPTGTPKKGTLSEDQFNDNEMTELSHQIETNLRTESPSSAQNNMPPTSEPASAVSSTGKQQTQPQQQTKRVPGLMDVKVPTSTSRNLAYLWEQEDYFSGSSGRGGRGRSKLFSTEKARGGSRGRRGGRFASDDINILRTNSGEDRGAANPSGSHDDYEDASNVRPWHPKSSSRRTFKPESENPLTSSDIQLEVSHAHSDAKPSYGSEPEDYTDRTDRFQDESGSSSRRYGSSTGAFEASNVGRQGSGPSKSRAKPAHGELQDNELSNHRRADYPRQHERARRGRGGSGFYYTSSRTYNNDEGSSKQMYVSEQKPYTRITRGGNSGGGSGTFPTRSHRSGPNAAYPESGSRRRNLDEVADHDDRTGQNEEYPNQRPQREIRHDREWRSHEPVDEKTYQKGRGHSRTLDMRRGSAYRDEYNFSDSEPRIGDGRRNQGRHHPSNQRNRSHDGQRYTQRGASRQNTAGQGHERASSQSADVDERQTQPTQEKPATHDTVDDYEEGDLPTVRVPPMDMAFKSSRSHYTRGHRSTTFQRGSGIRRIASSRTTGPQQQQSKRSSGSNVQGSRRYRDLQNRYRDDRDDDGGAAAGGGGGTGQSATGGDRTNAYGSGGSSGANGCGDLNDQSGGGSHNKGSNNDSAHDGNNEPTDSQYPDPEPSKPSVRVSAESNENNTTHNSSDVPRSQRFASTSRGTIGDACDAEEWETATEGSSDPESASSNPGAGGNLSTHLPSHTDDNVTVCADSKQVITDLCASQPVTSGPLSVHYGETNVADCASSSTSPPSTMVVSSAPNSAIGSAALALNQPSGSGRAGCHLYEHDKYPHDRRGSGGGSGGTSASDVHGAPASTTGVRGRKFRSTNVSAPGGRPSGGQGFRRQGFIRSGPTVTSSRSAAVVAIPPLMSITPEGPFTRSERDFDSVFNSGPLTSNQTGSTAEADDATKPEATEASTQNRQGPPDSSAEDPEDQEFSSDGFTKVVSKSIKKQARRRLQMELSAAAAAAAVMSANQKSTSRRQDDGKIAHSKQTPNERSSTRSERSPHSSIAHRSKNQDSMQSGTQLPLKTKPFPVKPTFMGPPVCLTDAKSCSVSVGDQKSGVTLGESKSNDHSATKRPVVSVGTPTLNGNANTTPPGNANTGRTWSKVVGAKATVSPPTTIVKETVLDKSSGQKTDFSWATKRQSVDQPSETAIATVPDTIDGCTKSVNVSEELKPIWPSAPCDDKETRPKPAHDSPPEPADVTVHVSSVSTPCSITATTAPASTSLSGPTAVTNVCKVRPQQQQQQQQPSPQVGPSAILPSVANAPTSSVTPLSPIANTQEQTSTLGICNNDLTALESERMECNFDVVAAPNRNVSRPVEDGSSSLLPTRPIQNWNEGLPTSVPGNYFEGRTCSSNYESPFSANNWPVADVDPTRGVNVQPHYGQLSSDGTYASPSGGSLATDMPAKATHPMALAPRHQPYSVQPYNHNPTPTGDAHLTGMYGNSFNDVNKIAPSSTLSQAPHTTFTPMGGQVYVTPQQPTSNPPSQPAGSFTGWTVPPNAQPNQIPQGMTHGPRFRQRMAHQVDISSFGGYPFPSEMPNEFAFLPSVTACVPAPPSGGLYSTIQGQAQTNYHHGSTRSTMGSSSGAAWSLLGTSSGPATIQASNNEYNSGMAPTPIGSAGGTASGGGGGLLPHPIAQGYNNPVAPISSSSGSSYMTHPSYVGVIGGGRPSATDMPSNSGRQRNIPQGLYPAHTLTHSPSAQSQQPFQLHSPFYPSLSPSHQRVHLQQFPGAQGRGNIHGFLNPQNNLYAATYGPSPSQPTPPPLHSQMGYPNNFSTESSVAPPGAFHSNVQSHSFSNLGMQPTHPHVHGHRSLQSSGPQMVSRNMSAVNSHGGSALVIPGAVGPSGVSALPGYPQPTAQALSVSGYPLKPVLPTL